MILVVDHYDSFTYNLVQLVESLGHETAVVKSDAEPAEALVARAPAAVILSPGPGRPESAGCFTDLLEVLPDTVPVLGVCLGHQAIGVVYGGTVCRAAVPMHGKTSTIEHDGRGVFSGIAESFVASRYHSLVVAEQDLPAELEVSARTKEDGTIMGLRHRSWPVHGVQFHPESILTGEGRAILRNFLEGKA